jgi:hypothetical protein
LKVFVGGDYIETGSGTYSDGSATGTWLWEKGRVYHDGGRKRITWHGITQQDGKVPQFYSDGDGPFIRFRHLVDDIAWLKVEYTPFPCDRPIAGQLSGWVYNGGNSADANWYISDQHVAYMGSAGWYGGTKTVTGNPQSVYIIEERQDRNGYNYFQSMLFASSVDRTIVDGGIVLSGNCINFAGVGDLTVIVEPYVASSSTLTVGGVPYTLNQLVTGGNTLAVTLSPSTHQYNDMGNNIYRIDLSKSDNVTISDLQVAESSSTVSINKVLLDSIGAPSGTNWHKDANQNLITPTEAVKNVTAEACAKLKSDYGTNIRVYVVKYGSSVTDPGNYIRDCASAPDYVYFADTPEALNTALQVIADDIKSFAGYKAAANVP